MDEGSFHIFYQISEDGPVWVNVGVEGGISLNMSIEYI